MFMTKIKTLLTKLWKLLGRLSQELGGVIVVLLVLRAVLTIPVLTRGTPDESADVELARIAGASALAPKEDSHESSRNDEAVGKEFGGVEVRRGALPPSAQESSGRGGFSVGYANECLYCCYADSDDVYAVAPQAAKGQGVGVGMTANKMNWIAQLQRDLARLNAAIAQWDTRIERWTALAAKRSSKFMNAGEQLIYAHLILARNQTLS